jgi:hypothetical protein
MVTWRVSIAGGSAKRTGTQPGSETSSMFVRYFGYHRKQAISMHELTTSIPDAGVLLSLEPE